MSEFLGFKHVNYNNGVMILPVFKFSILHESLRQEDFNDMLEPIYDNQIFTTITAHYLLNGNTHIAVGCTIENFGVTYTSNGNDVRLPATDSQSGFQYLANKPGTPRVSIPILFTTLDNHWQFAYFNITVQDDDPFVTITEPSNFSFGTMGISEPFGTYVPSGIFVNGFGLEYYSPSISEYFNANPPADPDYDPYIPNSEPGGGGGENQNSDDMGDETLPTISAIDTGFVTLYKPSIGQLNSLASYMWGTLDIDVFKKVFANPMDVILGLSILPGIVPSGGSSSVMVGNIDTGVSMTKVGNQYVKFNCGSVTIKRKWGAFLDYSPYTKAFIYLPFIGTHPIDVDEIMNKTVSVVYNIDILSGGCCAFVKVDGTTLYNYIGQCAASVPVTGKDWSTMINGVLGAVSSVAGTIGSVASGNLMGAVSGVASIAQNVASAKPTYQRSGSMGGMGGMMGIKTPYIIIERPVQAVPGYQNEIIGYPSFVTRRMNQFSGYTEIEKCHLENVPATADEIEEIENLLMSGVIF